MSREADDLEAYCVRHLDFKQLGIPTEYGYRHLPLCVIDSVWSIGVRYEGVQSVVNRYCEFVGLPLPHVAGAQQENTPAESEHTIEDSLRVLEPHDPEFLADRLFMNRQRTSTRSGILKAEAVVRWSQALLRHGVSRLADIESRPRNVHLEEDIARIPGHGSGISLKYFYMTCGADNYIKPDRMIYRFIQRAVGRSVSEREAESLMTEVAARLKESFPSMSPLLLDNLVWKHQRNQPIYQDEAA